MMTKSGCGVKKLKTVKTKGQDHGIMLSDLIDDTMDTWHLLMLNMNKVSKHILNFNNKHLSY